MIDRRTIGLVFLCAACKQPAPSATVTVAVDAAEDVTHCACTSRQSCVHDACERDPQFQIVDVAMSQLAACAVYKNGRVSCVGRNTAGELGNGGAMRGYQALDENVSDVIGVTNATHIAMGGQFACAIVESGAVWCWGSNAAGQLGTKVDIPGVGQMTSTPVQVKGITDATAISLDSTRACALRKNGTVMCWGGEPGAGMQDGNAAHAVPKLANVKQIAIGSDRSYALHTNGTITSFIPDGFALPVKLMTSVDEIAIGGGGVCARMGAVVKCVNGWQREPPAVVDALAGTSELRGTSDAVCGFSADHSVHCATISGAAAGAPTKARLFAMAGPSSLLVADDGSTVCDHCASLGPYVGQL